MRIAICQFGATSDPKENAETITTFAEQASRDGAELLITPESSLVRLPSSKEPLIDYAQDTDGAFARDLMAASKANGISIIAGSYTPGDDQRVVNTLLVIVDGKVVESYDKIHLYDAFAYKESDRVKAGPPEVKTIDINGVRFGLLTCYDLRFPEMFRALSDAGAQAFVVPAAWVKGTSKEEHWFTLLKARAIENTAYVLASGESGEKCIGRSTAFDPMGLQLTDLGDEPGYGLVDIDLDRLARVRRVVPTLEHRKFQVSKY